MEFYLKRIRRDQLNDRMIELAIVHNPNAKDPNKLVYTFKNALNELDGKSYLYKERMTKDDERKLKELARLMKRNAMKRRYGSS